MVRINGVLNHWFRDFDYYQVILLLSFCVINLLSAVHYYSQTIIGFVPNHWCYDGSFQNASDFLATKRGTEPSCSTDDNPNISCDKHIYDEYMGYKSLTMELDWICESAWKLTLGQSMFFVGSVIGTFGFGILADKIGRVPVLILANLTAMAGNMLSVFTNSLATFSIFRLISGLGTDSNFMMMYIIVLEYIAPAYRTFGVSICIGIFYCLGSVVAPWIAVLAQSWKLFLIVTSVPFLIVPLFYFIIPESIEWLLSKQKYDQVAESLRKIAKINGKPLCNSDIDVYVQEHRQKPINTPSHKTNFWGLFKTPRLRRNMLILFFKSMVITLCYDAVSRNVNDKGISPFAMFSLSASTILPACLVLILVQDRIGRKAMSSVSLLMSGMFISTTGFILSYNERSSEKSTSILIVLSVIGRFGVTIAYNSGAQYATELIPTSVRGQGIAAIHFIGYGFTFFSSYILYSREFFKAMPELILGAMSFIGSMLCLLLPETTNKKLPCTLEDGENFGKDEVCICFICWKNKGRDTHQDT